MSVIIDIDHEAGNLSEYTSYVDDAGDLSVTAGAALAGTNYGLSCLIDDTTAIYGSYALGANDTSGIVRFRVYFDPNSLTMANNDKFVLVYLLSGSGSGVFYLEIIYTTAGGYSLRIGAVDDASAVTYTSAYAITDAPHYVECQLTRSSGANDGTLSLWIDGTFKQTVTGLDNDTKFASFKTYRNGAVSGLDAGTSGTFYLDQIIVNNDGSTIGPAGGHAPLTVDHGDYTLTGEPAGVRVARTLAMGQGSFTLAGQSAGLTHGYKTAMAQGSYTLAGQAAGLRTARRLAAAAGSYALTGKAVALKHAIRVQLALGIYQLTGQALGLLKGARPGTPADHTLDFLAESRTVRVPEEIRRIDIDPESRATPIPWETRQLDIEPESRVFSIKP